MSENGALSVDTHFLARTISNTDTLVRRLRQAQQENEELKCMMKTVQQTATKLNKWYLSEKEKCQQNEELLLRLREDLRESREREEAQNNQLINMERLYQQNLAEEQEAAGKMEKSQEKFFLQVCREFLRTIRTLTDTNHLDSRAEMRVILLRNKMSEYPCLHKMLKEFPAMVRSRKKKQKPREESESEGDNMDDFVAFGCSPRKEEVPGECTSEIVGESMNFEASQLEDNLRNLEASEEKPKMQEIAVQTSQIVSSDRGTMTTSITITRGTNTDCKMVSIGTNTCQDMVLSSTCEEILKNMHFTEELLEELPGVPMQDDPTDMGKQSVDAETMTDICNVRKGIGYRKRDAKVAVTNFKVENLKMEPPSPRPGDDIPFLNPQFERVWSIMGQTIFALLKTSAQREYFNETENLVKQILKEELAKEGIFVTDFFHLPPMLGKPLMEECEGTKSYDLPLPSPEAVEVPEKSAKEVAEKRKMVQKEKSIKKIKLQKPAQEDDVEFDLEVIRAFYAHPDPVEMIEELPEELLKSAFVQKSGSTLKNPEKFSNEKLQMKNSKKVPEEDHRSQGFVQKIGSDLELPTKLRESSEDVQNIRKYPESLSHIIRDTEGTQELLEEHQKSKEPTSGIHELLEKLQISHDSIRNTGSAENLPEVPSIEVPPSQMATSSTPSIMNFVHGQSFRKFNPQNDQNVKKCEAIVRDYLHAEWVTDELERFVEMMIILRPDESVLFDALGGIAENSTDQLVFNPFGSLAPLVPKTHQQIIIFCHNLAKSYPDGFLRRFLHTIERRMFTLTPDKKCLKKLINLTYLLIPLMDLQFEERCGKISARTFIFKCLYYFHHKAPPLIYMILKAFPDVLPDAREFASNDPMLLAIICALANLPAIENMETEYSEFKKKELLQLLIHKYKFTPGTPSPEETVGILMGHLRQGNCHDVSHALTLLAKRMGNVWTETNLMRKHLIPRLNDVLLEAADVGRNQQIITLITAISNIVKSYPNMKDPSEYHRIFSCVLDSMGDQPMVQEAVIGAHLRLARFGMIQVFSQIYQWHSHGPISRHLAAALETFVHRKPKKFWMTLEKQMK